MRPVGLDTHSFSVAVRVGALLLAPLVTVGCASKQSTVAPEVGSTAAQPERTAEPERSVPRATWPLELGAVRPAQVWESKRSPQPYKGLHGASMTLGSETTARDVALSPDATIAATARAVGDRRTKITLYKPTTGEPLRSFEHDRASIIALVFSPDAKHLLIQSQLSAQVYQVASGKPALDAPTGGIAGAAVSNTHVSFSSTVDDTCKVELVDLVTGSATTYVAPVSKCGPLALSSTGRVAVLTDGPWDYGRLAVVDVAQKKTLADIDLPLSADSVYWIANERIAFGSEHGLGVADSKTGAMVWHHRLERYQKFVGPDWASGALWSTGFRTRAWDPATGESVPVELLTNVSAKRVIAGHNGWHWTQTQTGWLAWDLAGGKRILLPTDAPMGEMAFTRAGTRLATNGFQLWSLETGRLVDAELRVIHKDARWIAELAAPDSASDRAKVQRLVLALIEKQTETVFYPMPKRKQLLLNLAIPYNEVKLRVVDFDGRLVRELPGVLPTLHGVSRGGDYIVAGPMRNARLYSLDTGKEIRSVGVVRPRAAVFSPGSDRLAVVRGGTALQSTSTVEVVDTLTGKSHFVQKIDGFVRTMAWSANGKALAIAHAGPKLDDDDDAILVVDAASGRELQRLTGAYSAMALSPDGKQLAAMRSVMQLATPRSAVDIVPLATGKNRR